MNKNSIELLRDEAIRLIDVEINLIRRMLQSPTLLTKSNESKSQTMDAESAQKSIEMLEGEKSKLADLELVLAVVGTMKAGKSTTINAIVGTEVLPNRNRPMTALPTLIRHTPGQVEPLLRFAHGKPIEQLLKELHRALKSSKNKEQRSRCAQESEDISRLIDLIEGEVPFQTIYKGAKEIFEFLRSLNDLVRLSSDMGVVFPFDQYTQIGELPVIEVEFAHLRESGQSTGRLTLLDTPGPNESGQPHLKKMLREQLEKASAVLAVLDYTQLKSDADAQVRQELMDLAKVTESRLYALVNKFDQRDRNGDDRHATQTFVADKLLEGNIDQTNVFPVSSRWAYLANRARHELHLYRVLPPHRENAWVGDFGEEAFGRRWESCIKDPVEVEKGAEFLWKDSLFTDPLEKVIRAAHDRAALFALESAAAKLLDTVEKIGSLLSVRHAALKKSTNELRDQISAIKNDLESISQLEKKTKADAANLIKEFGKNTNNISELLGNKITEEIDKYFKEGKKIERAAVEKKNRLMIEEKKTERRRGFLGVMDSLIGQRSFADVSANSDFDPKNPIIKFEKLEDAQELASKIANSIDVIFMEGNRDLKDATTAMLKSFEDEFQNGLVSQASEMIQALTMRLGEQGFSVKLNMPKSSVVKLQFTGAEMLESIVQEKQQTVTRSRVIDSYFAKFRNWLNDDWGKEYYDHVENFFEIDIKKIRTQTTKGVKAALDGLGQSVEQFIKQPMNDGIEEFFNQFSKTIDQLRGDFEQSIKDKELSRAEQDELEAEITSNLKVLPGPTADIAGLRKDIAKIAGSIF